MKQTIKVFLVDDHPVVREGLRTMLAAEAGFEVVGEAQSGEEAVEKAVELGPNVVLMDIRMPGIGGLEAARQIKRACPTTAVVFMTMYDSDMYVVQAVRCGAAGYLTKDCSRDLLLHALRAAVDGGMLIRSDLLHRAVRAPGGNRPGLWSEGEPVERLTPRELEVLELLSQGRGNREICGDLHLAEVTVKKHVQSIIGKLRVNDRTQAAILGSQLASAGVHAA